MSQSGYVLLENCDVIRETDRAFLIRYEDEQVWIPKGQIAREDQRDLSEGDEGVSISVTEWIAEQKGIV